jgi:hypothetical protein
MNGWAPPGIVDKLFPGGEFVFWFRECKEVPEWMEYSKCSCQNGVFQELSPGVEGQIGLFWGI